MELTHAESSRRERDKVRFRKYRAGVFALATIGCITSCSDSDSETKLPDVANTIQRSLDDAGLNDVSVSQDRERGVLTLRGTTISDVEKSRAESIASSVAGVQSVSNQIAVREKVTSSK
jgi:hyperosmotically inducible periplasmic protein